MRRCLCSTQHSRPLFLLQPVDAAMIEAALCCGWQGSRCVAATGCDTSTVTPAAGNFEHKMKLVQMQISWL